MHSQFYQPVAAHLFLGINALPHINGVHFTTLGGCADESQVHGMTLQTYLLPRCTLPLLKGQKRIAELCTVIVVIHEGGLELRINFTSENAKVETFEHVT